VHGYSLGKETILKTLMNESLVESLCDCVMSYRLWSQTVMHRKTSGKLSTSFAVVEQRGVTGEREREREREREKGRKKEREKRKENTRKTTA